MRLYIGIIVVASTLAIAIGCPLEDPCPEGVALGSVELPCSCGLEVIDALPGDGSTCVCDPDEGMVCEPLISECLLDTPFDDSELPCQCGSEIVEALPGDGSTCVCSAIDGFVCEAPPSGTDCPLDVDLDGSELPCLCAGATIDALPGHGGACRCDASEGFVCDRLDIDEDGDGYFVDDDCNDEDASIHPGAVDDCNRVDDDCDGEVDEDCATTS